MVCTSRNSRPSRPNCSAFCSAALVIRARAEMANSAGFAESGNTEGPCPGLKVLEREKVGLGMTGPMERREAAKCGSRPSRSMAVTLFSLPRKSLGGEDRLDTVPSDFVKELDTGSWARPLDVALALALASRAGLRGILDVGSDGFWGNCRRDAVFAADRTGWDDEEPIEQALGSTRENNGVLIQ
jgi:hypothetical protein